MRTLSSKTDPLNIELDQYLGDMDVNATSAVMAARESVKCFDKLGAEGVGSTFIYTGNKLNVMDIPGVFLFGCGKAVASKLIQVASHAYKPKGYK